MGEKTWAGVGLEKLALAAVEATACAMDGTDKAAKRAAARLESGAVWRNTAPLADTTDGAVVATAGLADFGVAAELVALEAVVLTTGALEFAVLTLAVLPLGLTWGLTAGFEIGGLTGDTGGGDFFGLTEAALAGLREDSGVGLALAFFSTVGARDFAAAAFAV